METIKRTNLYQITAIDEVDHNEYTALVYSDSEEKAKKLAFEPLLDHYHDNDYDDLDEEELGDLKKVKKSSFEELIGYLCCNAYTITTRDPENLNKIISKKYVNTYE